MQEPFSVMLLEGGKSNSLGRAEEIVGIVLENPERLDELYVCLFEEDAWARMRAADALEKVCRVHPEWLEPYIDRFFEELAESKQASIQWHLAQIFHQVNLTDAQRQQAISWLAKLLSDKTVDWIVSANSMDTLAKFNREGHFPARSFVPLLEIQQHHHSKAVVKRAAYFLETIS